MEQKNQPTPKPRQRKQALRHEMRRRSHEPPTPLPDPPLWKPMG